MNKKCELCGGVARMYCESDQASLCWDCDQKVHGANFLVAKHTRCLLCSACQSPTPWKAAGPRLGPTVSACESCVSLQNRGGRGSTNTNGHHLSENRSQMTSGHDYHEDRFGDHDGGAESYDDGEENDEDEEYSDDDDDDDEEEEEEDNDDDDDEETENQVVPWAASAALQPPVVSSSSSVSSGGEEAFPRRDGGGLAAKRTRGNSDLLYSDEMGLQRRERRNRIEINGYD